MCSIGHGCDNTLNAFIYVGTLCGKCRDEDEGVSALLNQCVTCSSASGLLILALSQSHASCFQRTSY